METYSWKKTALSSEVGTGTVGWMKIMWREVFKSATISFLRTGLVVVILWSLRMSSVSNVGALVHGSMFVRWVWKGDGSEVDIGL